MKPHLLVLTAGTLVAAGCAAPPRLATREPYVKPGLIVLTADQAERRGIHLAAPDGALPPTQPGDPLDAAAVVATPVVKAYALSRAVDPADAELMHEAHVVYRRESSPQWRLDAPLGQRILVGPRVTDGRQEIQPLLTKELTTFLVEQRRVTEANQKAIAALFESVEALHRQQQVLAQRPPRASTDGRAPATDATPTIPAPDP